MTRSWRIIEEKLDLYRLGDVIAKKVVGSNREKNLFLFFFSLLSCCESFRWITFREVSSPHWASQLFTATVRWSLWLRLFSVCPVFLRYELLISSVCLSRCWLCPPINMWCISCWLVTYHLKARINRIWFLSLYCIFIKNSIYGVPPTFFRSCVRLCVSLQELRGPSNQPRTRGWWSQDRLLKLSAADFCRRGAHSLSRGAVLCIVGCLAAFLASIHNLPPKL